MIMSIPITVRSLGFATLAALGLSMSACTHDAADLRAYVAEVKSRPGGKLEKLPEYPPPPPIPQVSLERDPFKSFVTRELARKKPVDLPWPPRNQEELEHYALDSLRMVGTLEQQGEQWGLIKGPDSIIYRVKAGNFMGQNYGKILEVSEQRIHLLERVSDAQGNWEDRKAEIAVSD